MKFRHLLILVSALLATMSGCQTVKGSGFSVSPASGEGGGNQPMK